MLGPLHVRAGDNRHAEYVGIPLIKHSQDPALEWPYRPRDLPAHTCPTPYGMAASWDPAIRMLGMALLSLWNDPPPEDNM